MIDYRPLTSADTDAFIELRIRQLREEGAKDDLDLRPALRDYYARHMADGSFIGMLGVDGGRIIATGGVSIVENPPRFGCPSARIALLSSMFTEPEYRRRGIAREILRRIVDAARERGCGAVHITASDMGVLLYADFGFVKNGNFMQYAL